MSSCDVKELTGRISSPNKVTGESKASKRQKDMMMKCPSGVKAWLELSKTLRERVRFWGWMRGQVIRRRLSTEEFAIFRLGSCAECQAISYVRTCDCAEYVGRTACIKISPMIILGYPGIVMYL